MLTSFPTVPLKTSGEARDAFHSVLTVLGLVVSDLHKKTAEWTLLLSFPERTWR